MGLDVDLFERTRSGMIPTAYGQSYLGHARAMLEELKRAGDDLRAIRDNQAGQLSVGVTPVVSSLVPSAICALRHERANVRVLVHNNRLAILMPELLSGQLDMIIGPINPEEIVPPIEAETLFSSTLEFIVARDHPLARMKGIKLEDIMSAPNVILPPTSVFRRRDLDRLFQNAGLGKLIAAVETTSLSMIRALLLEEHWICVLPESSFRADIMANVMVKLDLGDAMAPTRRHTGVIFHKSRPLSVTAREMRRHLRILTSGSGHHNIAS